MDEGLTVGRGTSLDGVALIEPPVWIGEDCEIGGGVRLMGPVVIGDRARIGDGAALRDSIVFPGSHLEAATIAIGAILGHVGIVESLRPYESL